MATKRAVRALLKATDLCALAPERAARHLVDKGVTKSYDSALQSMTDIPYGTWRSTTRRTRCGSTPSGFTKKPG